DPELSQISRWPFRRLHWTNRRAPYVAGGAFVIPLLAELAEEGNPTVSRREAAGAWCWEDSDSRSRFGPRCALQLREGFGRRPACSIGTRASRRQRAFW